jgi:hypothetical protein
LHCGNTGSDINGSMLDSLPQRSYRRLLYSLGAIMNTQSENPHPRRKWETPALSVLAFRDTRTKTLTLHDANMPMHSIISDIRAKCDVVAVGQLDNGIGVYRYRYLWNDQAYVGVMAQEVAEIVPDAVLHGEDGYLRVDYARLGLRLMTWEEWVAGGSVTFNGASAQGRREGQRRLN